MTSVWIGRTLRGGPWSIRDLENGRIEFGWSHRRSSCSQAGAAVEVVEA